MNLKFQNYNLFRRLICIGLVTLLFVVFSLNINVRAQSGGTFPGEPFNGLQIEYSISGADLDAPLDEEGFTWSRRVDGSLTNRTLVVSGVARAANGWGANLVVQLSADGTEPVEYSASKFPEGGLFPDPMEQPFSVSIDIPSGAENASFSISLTGDYNAGSRAVVVSGNLIGGRTLGGETGSSMGVPAIIIVILAGGAGAVVIAGGVIIAKIASSALKKPSKVLGNVHDPQVAQTIDAWEQVASQADLEAENYIRQWDAARTSGNPNDPDYQALQQKYQDYIDYQRRQAAEARQRAREIEAREQEYEREERQQQAYRQHRQAENEFIERESINQVRRQGAFDQQLDQLGQDQQQKLEQLKTRRRKYRNDFRKELIKARQMVDRAEANQNIAAGVIPGVLETSAEWVQWGADTAINVIAQVAPGTKPVKTGYLYFRGLAGGAGEAWADKANWKNHLAMGFKKGTIDATVYIIKDKPLSFVPTRLKNFAKPQWVNLPGNTNILNVKGGEWLRGGGQALISKIRSKLNPIVYGGNYLKGLKF